MTERGRGAPPKKDQDKLLPRFTLNMTDEQNETFIEAVKLSKQKRSEFARNAVIKASDAIIAKHPSSK